MRYRRALRSHSELLTKVTNKYLEAQDIAVRLKGVIEGEGEVGGACNLHFNMLQVPKDRNRCCFINVHPRR